MYSPSSDKSNAGRRLAGLGTREGGVKLQGWRKQPIQTSAIRFTVRPTRPAARPLVISSTGGRRLKYGDLFTSNAAQQ